MAWADEEGNKEPAFIKLYLDDLSSLKGLTRTHRIVLDVLMKYTKYDNDVIITKEVKKEMLSYCDISDGVFKNALTVLVKKDLIKRNGTRGIYKVNPKLAYKGKVNERARLVNEYDGLGNRDISIENVDKDE